MYKKLFAPALFILGFIAIVFIAIGYQTCGNVYTDQDARTALLQGDTVPSGIATNGAVTRADPNRDYAWVCTNHIGVQNTPFMIAGLLVIAFGVVILVKNERAT